MELIIDQYIDKFVDKKRCHCHKEQYINIDEQHVKLFLENDNNPKTQFLLSYYFYYKDEKKSKEFANRAIENGFNAAYNILGCIMYKENGTSETTIPYFHKALNSNYTVCINLAACYHNIKDDDNTKKFLNLGIQEGILCCKYMYHKYYCCEDPNLDQLRKYAENCRSAFDELFEKISDPIARYKLMKLAIKKNYTDYIPKLGNYYELNNRYKFISLLNKFKDSNDDQDLLFWIASKYINIDQQVGINLMYRSMEKGSYKAYNYLVDTHIINIDANNAEIFIEFLKKLKNRTSIDNLNLAISYMVSGKIDEMNNLIDSFDLLYKNVALYKYYGIFKNYDKALEYLKLAFSIDEDPLLEFEFGRLYLFRNDKNKAIEHLEKGLIAGDTRCNIALAELFYTNNQMFEACQYLIKNKIAMRLIYKIICNHPSYEIGKLLLDNNLDIGILCLLKCESSNEEIIECAKEYVFQAECCICFQENKHLKLLCGHTACITCLKMCKEICPFCKSNFNGFLRINN